MAMTMLAIFCAGAFALTAQVVLARETLVAFHGNELSIGAVIASWMVGVGLGAVFSRVILSRCPGETALRGLVTIALSLSACALPVQVVVVRTARLWMEVPAGTYMSLWNIVSAAWLACIPSSFAIGVSFSLFCRIVVAGGDGRDGAGVGKVYTLESLGSAVAGLCLTFVLLPLCSSTALVCVGAMLALMSAGCVWNGKMFRTAVVCILIVVVCGAVVRPAWVTGFERRMEELRWKSFGVMGVSGGSQTTRLIGWKDTVYQHLALFETDGQFSLYSNGEVAWIYPDKFGYEHGIHFVMSQNPSARRVLLLGGCAAGDIPEILKYPVETLVHVDLDPGMDELMGLVAADTAGRIAADARVVRVHEDIPRYAGRCRDKFDVIIVHGPEPLTAGANRFYTVSFFTDLRRCLADGGFVYTSVMSSERLQSEALDIGASVYRGLASVFPKVLVTAEARNRFLAGGDGAPITFNSTVLVERARKAGIQAEFFRPEYFLSLAADGMDSEKTGKVAQTFRDAEVPENTNLRPAAYYFSLVLWSRFSGSGIERVMSGLLSLSWSGIVMCIVLVSGVIALIGLLFGRRTARGWTRGMISLVVVTTGFLAMAVEMVLLLLYQGLFGYIYAAMGMVIGVFMIGLSAGAHMAGILCKRSEEAAWRTILCLEMAMLALCLEMALFFGSIGGGTPSLGVEVVVFATVFGAAALTGGEFVAANALFVRSGGNAGAGAAWTDAADNAGAAAGAMIVTVLLVPVLGVSATCLVLAGTKVGALALLSSVKRDESTGQE